MLYASSDPENLPRLTSMFCLTIKHDNDRISLHLISLNVYNVGNNNNHKMEDFGEEDFSDNDLLLGEDSGVKVKHSTTR